MLKRGMAVVSVYTVAQDVIAERWPDHADGDAASVYGSDHHRIFDEVTSLGVEVVAVVPAMDSAVRLADLLADLLGVPGNGSELALPRRDKAAMRRHAEKHGLRIPRFEVVADPERIPAAAASVGFPAICKHTTGGGSHGTRLVPSPEAAAGLRRSGLHQRDLFGSTVTQWLVEQYVRGREFAVNCFSHGGRHRVVDVWEYRQPGPQDYDFPYWESAQISPDDPDWEKVTSYVLRVLEAFDIRLGPTHTEVKAAPDGVHLMEIGTRLPGGPMTDQWLNHSDLDPFEQALDCYLGKQPACVATPVAFRRFCGASAIRNDGPAGTLTRIEGLEAVRRMPGVDKVLSVYRPGDHVPVTDSTRNIPVGVWVAAATPAGVIELLQQVRDTVRLVIRPDEGGPR
ncbi:ATP-grasp domain-containing protein [Kitasatospora sp. NPDC088346]|uniref:ATP-grasp domain-containing protein n=1 Tax=Kitasatospora sp. NPDC088346 TaxID=3364073 RepID=UPI00381250C2